MAKEGGAYQMAKGIEVGTKVYWNGNEPRDLKKATGSGPFVVKAFLSDPAVEAMGFRMVKLAPAYRPEGEAGDISTEYLRTGSH